MLCTAMATAMAPPDLTLDKVAIKVAMPSGTLWMPIAIAVSKPGRQIRQKGMAEICLLGV